MSELGLRAVGERAVMLDAPGPARPASLAAAIRRLAARRGIDVADVVPGAATVLAVAATPEQLARLVAVLADMDDEDDEVAETPAMVELPVRYDGPDLVSVAAATGLGVAEVVRRHSQATYRAAFTGFAPGFAYLTGLDPALELPRRSSFRPSVPAGSVAIADCYSAVYPRSSPGGWHLLGSTTAVMFEPDRSGDRRAALIAPGDLVRIVIQPGPLP
ncbi:MAG: 5-oxoprolinase subunit B family protein [Acidimicrobiales bacterium]